MIDRKHDLPITRQAAALGISRGSVYYLPRAVSTHDLALMRRIDELHLEDDMSRLRKGHGAANMAVVRHFAFNLLRQGMGKIPLKRMRKRASWNPKTLLDILKPSRR